MTQQQCYCGCGNYPKHKQSKFIAGHNLKGRTPWNKGKSLSEEYREKLSQAKIDNPVRYWKGKKRKMTDEWRKNMARTPWNKGKKMPKMSGANHFAWKGTTPLKEQIRKSLEYKQWRKSIYQRDQYTCQMCGEKGLKINAHHIKPFAEIFEEYKFQTIEDACQCSQLWDINNGKTLCVDCHRSFK